MGRGPSPLGDNAGGNEPGIDHAAGGTTRQGEARQIRRMLMLVFNSRHEHAHIINGQTHYYSLELFTSDRCIFREHGVKVDNDHHNDGEEGAEATSHDVPAGFVEEGCAS